MRFAETNFNASYVTYALINSGATVNLIYKEWVKQQQIQTHKLKNKVTLLNINKIANKNRYLKERCLLTVSILGNKYTGWFYCTHIRADQMILEMPWLKATNPLIN